jgi:hypothetical protein
VGFLSTFAMSQISLWVWVKVAPGGNSMMAGPNRLCGNVLLLLMLTCANNGCGYLGAAKA